MSLTGKVCATVDVPLPVVFLGLALRDVFGQRRGSVWTLEEANLRTHLEAALAWLCRAQDVCANDGVSYGFSLRGGWLPAYRETTGYLVPTLLAAANQLSRPDLRQRALRMADWLVEIQNADGSVSNPKYGSAGIVFDTGQVIFGLVAAFEDTQNDRYLQAAAKAGRWLVHIADEEGRWTRSEHMGNPHVYNSRTAWAGLILDRHLNSSELVLACRANLQWAVDNQTELGFFLNNSFAHGEAPYTHNISYAICGLQESGWLLADNTYVEAARRCADAVRALMLEDGFIPGAISINGAPTSWYSCLTGQCQLSIAWARQFEHSGDLVTLEASQRSLLYARRRHAVNHRDPRVSGGLAGSFPIWGRYAPLSFVNWAAKFFVDAALIALAREQTKDSKSPVYIRRPAG